MKQIKFSLFLGLAISSIVFLINLFKNNFLVTIFRTLLSAILISTILYLVQFIFKQLFNIDFFETSEEHKASSDELTEESENNLDSNINITVGEEEDFSLNSHSNKKKDFELENENSSLEMNYPEVEKITPDDFFENSNEEKNIENDFANNINFDFEENELNNNVFENKTTSFYNEDKILDKTKPLKERLGYEATYEELAKAIRTELKKDKE